MQNYFRMMLVLCFTSFQTTKLYMYIYASVSDSPYETSFKILMQLLSRIRQKQAFHALLHSIFPHMFNLLCYIHLTMDHFSISPIHVQNGHNNKQCEVLSNLQSVMQPYLKLRQNTNTSSTCIMCFFSNSVTLLLGSRFIAMSSAVSPDFKTKTYRYTEQKMYTTFPKVTHVKND